MTLSVTPMTAGGQATVSIANSSRVNQDVDVTLANGVGDLITVVVHIDGSGNGGSAFTVPSWASADISDGHCDNIREPIAAGTGE